jgi:flagellar biosynthesis anti-sigma factor FlgM
MRIDDNGMANVGASQLNRTKQTELAGQQGTRNERLESGELVQDKVNLSSLASSVAAEQDMSVARQDRLAELAAEFRAGRLDVNAEFVADAMIDQALEDTR